MKSETGVCGHIILRVRGPGLKRKKTTKKKRSEDEIVMSPAGTGKPDIVDERMVG